ncbi:MAG: apolipoprotein N-acyltransferase [Halioglobus sp.]|nr:apolipoprotein N-acyltransferase [Halioglobus sp.]
MSASRSEPMQRLLPLGPVSLRLLLFACGALLPLAFAPFAYWILAPLLVLPMLLVGLHAPPRLAAWLGFSFGAGLFLAGTYWIFISIHDFGNAPLWLSVVLTLGVVAIMAAWFALCGWLLSRLVDGRPWRLVSIGPSVWVLVEWLRGWVLSGFPWLTLGYSQSDSPLSHWLPVTGVYGVSMLLVLSSAGLVLFAYPQTRWRAALIVLLPWLLGAGLSQHAWTEATGKLLEVTMIQGGVPQDRKWLPEQFQPTLRLYRDALLGAGDSDIVIWPEVAIPSSDDRVQPYLDLLQRDLLAGQSLLLGILERDTEGGEERIYNSVLLLDGSRQQTYRKRHLVPFGEYFPVPGFVREWMRLMSLPNSDLSAGAAQQALLETPAGQRIAVAICYEDAYGAEQLYAFPAASLIVNVSNDAWFGDSIAPHQHLQIARTRGAEAGRYVMRATNNGVSALIAPDGSVVAIAPQFEFASLSGSVQPMRGMTPYARTGNWPVVSLALLIIVLSAWRERRAAQRAESK